MCCNIIISHLFSAYSYFLNYINQFSISTTFQRTLGTYVKQTNNMTIKTYQMILTAKICSFVFIKSVKVSVLLHFYLFMYPNIFV